MRLPWLSSIRFSQFQKGVLLDMANSILETISSEFASAAEKVGSSVVAVHARRWMPTSGIEWKEGVVVTVTLFPKPTSRLRPLLTTSGVSDPYPQIFAAWVKDGVVQHPLLVSLT
jgi:hypothetical protein